MIWRHLRYRLEAVLVRLLYLFFKALPVDAASALGGWLGRTFGPYLSLSKRARRNLRRAFPEMDEARREEILRGMWDNLGRVAAEFPHLPSFRVGPGERIEVEGTENIELLRDDGKPGVFFAGHLGNWELNGLCAAQFGLPLNLVYRAANNPYMAWLFQLRKTLGIHLIPKGAAGARQVLDALKRGEHLGMLVDQKMNDGIAVPFFGVPAMTAPALAQFALRFKCPVVGARVERLQGCRFRVVVEKPMTIVDTGDRHADVLAVMAEVNRTLEGWVRQRPEQWMWLHKRWPEEVPTRDPEAAE